MKLTGKKFDLSKNRNVTRPGIVVQAKTANFLYLIQYEYNNHRREDWFSVDNITCRTVQEQEQRLSMTTGKTEKKTFSSTK